MKERELRIVDLIVDILLSWRSIIMWMLVGAVLLGGFSYWKSMRAAEKQKAVLELLQIEKEEMEGDKGVILEKMQSKLTDKQKNNVQKVFEYEAMKGFYEDSLYLQMDAAKLPKVELSFLVKASVLEKSYSIERLYEDTLGNGLQHWMVENGLDAHSNVSELVLLDRGTEEIESDSFRVQVIHVSEELCKELAQQIVDYINACQENIEIQAGKHEIILVNQAFAHVRDEAVLEKQEKLDTNIANLDATISKAVEAFSDEEKAYHDFMNQIANEEGNKQSQLDESAAVQEEAVLVVPGISIKYVVLGMILFAFLYVFYLFLKFILNNKLRANDDISEIYDVPQLGRIPDNASEKKLFGFIDRLILKIRDRNRRTFANEEALGLACVAAKMAAKKAAFETVCCIGCDMKESTLNLATAIQNTLKEDGIELTVLNNVLYDQSTMEQLQGVKGAFLLEKAGVTLYDEIEKELELLSRQDIKILGVVVVE